MTPTGNGTGGPDPDGPGHGGDGQDGQDGNAHPGNGVGSNGRGRADQQRLPMTVDYPLADGPATMSLPISPISPVGPGTGQQDPDRWGRTAFEPSPPPMAMTRRSRSVEVLVIGAGPAGLAAAAALCQAGVGSVEVVDREQEAGGIPRHCLHTGFAVRDLHRLMSGPDYARWHVAQAGACGAEVRTGVSVTGWARTPFPGTALQVETTTADGLERVTARAVVLATGARERPRPARLVAGDRGRGVLTTGQLQQMVYLYGQPIGRRAVVVGAEHVSFSALLTLHHAGVHVAAMVTDQPHHQTWRGLRWGAALRLRAPVLRSSTIEQIVGRDRVQAVQVRRGNGRLQRVECDTVVFTGDWIPDHELARTAGLRIDPGTRGPRVDTSLRTSHPGVFAVGNLAHPVEPADLAGLRAREVVPGVLQHLAGRPAPDVAGVEVAGRLRRVWPNLASPEGPEPPHGGFLVWPTGFARRARVTVTQGERQLYSTRVWRLVPNRPHRLDAGWLAQVDADPAAPPVTITL